MINRTDYQPGETIYVATRKLQPRHVSITEAKPYEVVKRTPSGYKVKMQSAYKGEYLFKDCEHYMSTDVTEVIEALRCDLAKNIDDIRSLLSRLEHRDRVLYDLWYGGDGNVD